MITVNRSDLLAAVQADTIDGLRAVIARERAEHAEAIAQIESVLDALMAKSEKDELRIATLRLQIDSNTALSRAVAQRDAREYAASMQRTAAMQR